MTEKTSFASTCQCRFYSQGLFKTNLQFQVLCKPVRTPKYMHHLIWGFTAQSIIVCHVKPSLKELGGKKENRTHAPHLVQALKALHK